MVLTSLPTFATQSRPAVVITYRLKFRLLVSLVLINHSSLPIPIKSSIITAKSHSARQSAAVGYPKVRRNLSATASLSGRTAIRSL